MRQKSKVAIVILNWNGREFLESYLPSVVEHSLHSDIQIIIADNASEDDSLEFLRSNYPKLEIITLDKNYGFAGGYNMALQQVNAEYYILLNSDVEVTKNWIFPVIQYMDKNHDVAACMPKIKSYYEREYFEYAGAAGGFIDKFGYPFCRGRMFDRIESDHGQYDDIKEIFWATGACMFVRSVDFHDCGGFDSDFFAHMEEIDLCWRFKNKNLKICYHPDSVVYHVGGGTLPQGNPWKTYLNFRNSLFLLYKNLPQKRFLLKIVSRLLLDILSVFKFLFSFDIRDAGAIFKAHIAFYGNVGKLRHKRRDLPRNIENHDEIFNRSIVWQYFLKGKKKYSDLSF